MPKLRRLVIVTTVGGVETIPPVDLATTLRQNDSGELGVQESMTCQLGGTSRCHFRKTWLPRSSSLSIIYASTRGACDISA